MKLIVYTDGGSRGNPGQAAIGFVVTDEKGAHVHSEGKAIGIATNNEAEYRAVQEAYKWLLWYIGQTSYGPIESIDFFLDSQLVVRQLKGIYKIKNARLTQFVVSIKKSEQECPLPIQYREIPREKNSEADRLVNQALDDL